MEQELLTFAGVAQLNVYVRRKPAQSNACVVIVLTKSRLSFGAETKVNQGKVEK